MNPIKKILLFAAVVLSSAASAQLNSTIDLPYQSVFKNYQPHQDVPLRDWKASNEAVRAAGGWRQYLKESQASDASNPKDTTKPNMTDHSNHTPQSIEVKKP